jgi:Beta-propeller repeat
LCALAPLLLLASCDGGSDTGSGGTAGSTSNGGGGDTGGGGNSTGGGGDGGNGGNGGSGATAGGGAGGTPTTSTGAGECEPGAKEACYTGPDGSLDVGACKGGERTCTSDGTWGACAGQVTPLPETCNTPVDDDCNGQVNEGGDGCVCVPGAMGACYMGPIGTQDVGICKAGTGICNADGLGYGPCQGQVVPAAESCLGPEDEDCDGGALACTGNEQWHLRFGDPAAQSSAGVAAFNGGAVIAGTFEGTVNFGGVGLASAGATDVYVASFDYAPQHLWSKRFGDGAAQTATGVAVDKLGNVYVTGSFAGTIDPGGGAITSEGSTDVFLVKYDSAGTLEWAKSFGNASAQAATGVAVDGQGRVGIVGSFAGSVGFGGDLLTSAGGNDMFAAVLDKDGNHVWSKRFGDSAAQVGKAIAFGPAGEAVVAGDNSGTLDFGGGALTSAGATDVVLASFDAGGTHVWSKQLGNNVAQVATSVAVDEAGNVAVALTFQGQVNFGAGALASAGGNDMAVAKYTTGGMLLWGKRLGGTGADAARSVRFDPFGALLLAGDFSGTVDFGGGNLVSAGSTDVVVVKLDGVGAHVWSRRAGDNGAQVASGIAADTGGSFVTGAFAGAIDFGGGAMTSAGGNDVFLVKLAQ